MGLLYLYLTLPGVVEVTGAHKIAESTRSTESLRRHAYKISQLSPYPESKPTAFDETENLKYKFGL